MSIWNFSNPNLLFWALLRSYCGGGVLCQYTFKTLNRLSVHLAEMGSSLCFWWGGGVTCDGTVSLLGSGWLSFTYVHHGNLGWALALCTSWQGEGFNLHVHIFHYKGNNSGDGLTSPVTTGISVDDIVGM